MSRKIPKFKRMVKFQKNKLDLLKQQMASTQAQISSLNLQYEALIARLQETGRQNLSGQTVASLQQIELAM